VSSAGLGVCASAPRGPCFATSHWRLRPRTCRIAHSRDRCRRQPRPTGLAHLSKSSRRETTRHLRPDGALSAAGPPSALRTGSSPPRRSASGTPDAPVGHRSTTSSPHCRADGVGEPALGYLRLQGELLKVAHRVGALMVVAEGSQRRHVGRRARSGHRERVAGRSNPRVADQNVAPIHLGAHIGARSRALRRETETAAAGVMSRVITRGCRDGQTFWTAGRVRVPRRCRPRRQGWP
jgi:hypothetical protein